MRIITACFLVFLASTIALAQTIAAPKPITLGETHELWSAQLSEKRLLNIYLPDGYNDTTRYPVIYLLDGGIDEDFIHVVGLVQFNSQPWVARLPGTIVVGIANTDRKRDMTFPSTLKSDRELLPTSGGSEKFIAFIEKEVIPYVNSKFKTKGSRTIIGESLAGLLTTEILLRKPNLFDRYIIISPSIWWDNGSILKRPANFPKKTEGKTLIYIGTGKEGLTPGDRNKTMEGDAKQLKEKISGLNNNNIAVYLDYLPEENHATVAHPALFNAFKKLWPANK